MPEQFIVKQGHKATHMYFIAQGNCEVLVRNEFKKEVFVADLSPGCLFGEVALLFEAKRTASVRIKDQSTIGALSFENFNELCISYPEIE